MNAAAYALPSNLFGQVGPRCPVCSGWGRVFRLAFGGGVTRSPSPCVCHGTGVDAVEVTKSEIQRLQRRLEEQDRHFARLLTILNIPPGQVMNSRQFWSELIAWATADGTAIANTTTETIIFPNVVIPANYMQDGRALQLTQRGRFSTTATPTIRFRLRWGGVAGNVIWDSGTITTATVTAALWAVPGLDIQTRSNGATGTLFAMGECFVGSAAAPSVGSATGAPATGVFGSAGDDTPAAVTCDLTADSALSLTATWSAQSASNTLTGHQYLLRAEN